MEVQEREELSERSNSLRVELKIWEKSFAAANNGKKASRDDIKKHPDIGKTSRFGMLKSLVLKPS